MKRPKRDKPVSEHIDKVCKTGCHGGKGPAAPPNHLYMSGRKTHQHVLTSDNKLGGVAITHNERIVPRGGFWISGEGRFACLSSETGKGSEKGIEFVLGVREGANYGDCPR